MRFQDHVITHLMLALVLLNQTGHWVWAVMILLQILVLSIIGCVRYIEWRIKKRQA